MSELKLGYIGLGNQGAPMAKRLVGWPGGLIVFDNALWHDRVADPSQRDPETSAIRDVIRRVATDDRLRSVLLPLGDGLLVAQLLP